MNWPHEPNGTSSFVSWARKILRAAQASEIKPSPDVRVNRTVNGTFLEVIGGAGGSGEETPLTMMVITTLSGNDYYQAQPFDGTEVYGDIVYVAKPPPLRPSVDEELVDEVTLTYSYDTEIPTKDNERTASDGTNTELQVMFPRYIAYAGDALDYPHQCTIFAQKAEHTGVLVAGDEVEWIEVGPSRVWCRRYIQPS